MQLRIEGESIKLASIAVLGASGFLGSKILSGLSKNEDMVVRGFSRKNCSDLHPISTLSVKDYDVVINAIVDYGRNGDLEAYDANVAVPLKILQDMTEAGNGAFFFNLNSFFTKFPIPYYSPLRTYSLTKALFPGIARDYLRNNLKGLSQVSFLDFTIEHVYGPDDSALKFVPWLLGSMMDQIGEIELTSGFQTRDFVYVCDVVQIIALAIRRRYELTEITNLQIGTGVPTTLREFVTIASEITRYRGELKFGARELAEGEIFDSVADMQLSELLGYRDHLSVRQGLEEMLRKWQRH